MTPYNAVFNTSKRRSLPSLLAGVVLILGASQAGG